MKLVKTIALAAALAFGSVGFANARTVAPSPMAQHIIVPAIEGAIVGGILGAILCGPAAAACAIGNTMLTTAGGITTGVLIGAGVGVGTHVALGTVWPGY